MTKFLMDSFYGKGVIALDGNVGVKVNELDGLEEFIVILKGMGKFKPTIIIEEDEDNEILIRLQESNERMIIEEDENKEILARPQGNNEMIESFWRFNISSEDFNRFKVWSQGYNFAICS